MAKRFRKTFTIFFLLIVLLLSVRASLQGLTKEFIIPSSGFIGVSCKFSPLHIGDPSQGENPCFFYDENGKLVTIRIGGQWDFWPGYGNFWKSVNDQIKINQNISANCIRVQLYPDRLFVAGRRVGWEDDSRVADHFEELVKALKHAITNGSYYILTWFFRDDDPEWLPNWWVNESMDYSIFWNATVRDDFKWMLNQTFARIDQETVNDVSLLDYMVYWSFNEWLWTIGPMNDLNAFYGDKMRNPWRFSGETDFFGIEAPRCDSAKGCSNKSWVKWLQKKYNNDIDALKDAWNVTNLYGDYNQVGMLYWNYSGDETEQFGSLHMPDSGESYTGRMYDFTQWYNECAINLTRHIKDWINNIYPQRKLYYGADTYSPITSENSAAIWSCGFNPAAIGTVGDVLIYHIYGGYHAASTSDLGWFQGDWYQSLWMDVAAFGRAMRKPTVVDECGHTPWAWNEPWRYWIAGYYNVSISLAIANGIAGYGSWYGCIRWYSVNNTAVMSKEFQNLYKQAFDKYMAAENWIDKIEYDRICVVQHLSADFDLSRHILTWLKEAGYNPKYKIIRWNETHFIPSIPADTEVIISDPSWQGNLYVSNGTVSAYNQSLAEGKKLVLFGIREGGGINWKDFEWHWEHQISPEYFPISNPTYGINYQSNARDNSVLHVSVYGQSVAIYRNASNGWKAAYTTIWADNQITGTRLMNYSDGEPQNGNPQPFCIINDHIAWLSNLLGETSEAYGTGAYQGGIRYDEGYNLIFKKILEHWNLHPIVDIDITSPVKEVEATFAILAPTHGILALHNRNFTHGEFIFRVNMTKSGMYKDCEYIIYDESNDSLTDGVIGRDLEINGLRFNLPTNQSSIFIFRRNDIPSCVYSTAYCASENYENNTLTINILASVNVETAIKVYTAGLSITSWRIDGRDISYTKDGKLASAIVTPENTFTRIVINFERE